MNLHRSKVSMEGLKKISQNSALNQIGVRSITQSNRTNESIIKKDLKYVCHNYAALPIALVRGKGTFVWDVEGTKYYDFLGGYSALNQGHCHPKIVAEVIRQSKLITLTSRSFHNEHMGELGEYLS